MQVSVDPGAVLPLVLLRRLVGARPVALGIPPQPGQGRTQFTRWMLACEGVAELLQGHRGSVAHWRCSADTPVRVSIPPTVSRLTSDDRDVKKGTGTWRPGRCIIPTIMDTLDPAGEYLRISERYRQMSDEELLVLVPQSSELTPFAQQALANEVRSRGLKVEVGDKKPATSERFNPPRPFFQQESPKLENPSVSDLPDTDSLYAEDRKLVELCTVWSERDALQLRALPVESDGHSLRRCHPGKRVSRGLPLRIRGRAPHRSSPRLAGRGQVRACRRNVPRGTFCRCRYVRTLIHGHRLLKSQPRQSHGIPLIAKYAMSGHPSLDLGLHVGHPAEKSQTLGLRLSYAP